MLKTWLDNIPRIGAAYKFPVIDLNETVERDDHIVDFLADQLIAAHANPTMLKRELEILKEDVKTLNLNILENYLEQEYLPAKKEVIVRIGNFGEALCAQLLTEFEEFSLPIYKLRYREKKDWAIRLTDLCVLKTNGLPRPLICYGEVKTHSSAVDLDLGVKGHTSLCKEDALTHPEVLRFFRTMLYESADPEKIQLAEVFSKISLGKLEYDKRHDLFLVHDKETWREEILGRLQAITLDPRLVDFSVKVIHVTKLRELIELSYERMAQRVGVLTDD